MPFPPAQHLPVFRGLRPREPYAIPNTAAKPSPRQGVAERASLVNGASPSETALRTLQPAGPYVPAPLRTRPQVASTADAPMPWIEQFLQKSGELGDGGDAADGGEVAGVGADFAVDSDGGDKGNANIDARDEAEESWPLDDARAELTSLSQAINQAIGGSDADRRSTDAEHVNPNHAEAGHDDVGASLDLGALDAALAAPLPMWNDADMMDIMPVRAPMRDARESSDGTLWATHARNEPPIEDYAESVASLLESIARRVREGQVVVSGFAPEMSDAAGLAVTLASLLRRHE